MSTEVHPFRVEVPQDELDELHRRLAAARLPDQPAGAGWDDGVERGHLADLARRWRDEFDWRAVEARLNASPQIVTDIEGQPLHAVHARSTDPEAVPLLLLHGWPSTVADFLPVLPALVGHFHVVAPSLPGFGFSGPTLETGWDLERHARTLLELMTRLGYERFVVQGGDWGSIIGPHVARLAPERVALVHVNALGNAVITDWSSEDPMAGLSEEDVAEVYAAGAVWEERSGYATIMGTRPQTLGFALADSPVGLLAWHLEWFVDYDPTTSAQTPVDPDAVLTDVTITWLTGTAASSGRIHREAHGAFEAHEPSGVPTAVACFTGDHAVRGVAERSHRVVRWRRYDTGGHFASLQAPELLVADFVEACTEQGVLG